MATVGADLAHSLGHGLVGALVSAWPAVALVGSFELLMVLIRKHHQVGARQSTGTADDVAPGLVQPGPPVVQLAPTLEQMVRARAARHTPLSVPGSGDNRRNNVRATAVSRR